MTFVSIIIPFNRPKRYLKDCLDSLSEQNLDECEVILVLNGVGEEDIDDFLKEYSSRLNLIITKFDTEINVGKARNEGLKLAKGKYVYFIDSDDYIYRDGLSKLIEVAEDTGADFINGERINTAFIRGRFHEELQKESKVLLKKGNFNDRDFSFKLLVSRNTNPDEFISILHALIRKDSIGNVMFSEDERYDVDYDFMLDILDNIDTFIGVEDALYAKRTRDDPVNLTSLNQEPKEDNFLIKCLNYEKSADKIRGSEKYRSLFLEMAAKMHAFYGKEFRDGFLASPNNRWRNEYFDKVSDISDDFRLLKTGFMEKREIKYIQNGDKKSYARLVRAGSLISKFKKAFTSRKEFNSFIYKFYNKRPLNDNQIIFESFRGEYYSDSPKYLYEYLYENYGDDFDFVWVIDDDSVKIPGNPKRVKRFSLGFYREVARSRYWVINGRQSRRLSKRKNQVIISTWHGTPLKKLGLDMDNVYTQDPSIKRSYIKVAKAWDYLISPNTFTSGVYRSAFNYNGDILEYGYPRNDILYNASDEFRDSVKSRLNLPDDRKIILYAPTWRDDEFSGVGNVDFRLKLDLDKLKQSLGDDYIVLVRTHYFIAERLDLSDYEGFAFNVSDYDDIAELYLISDILVTDYSSVFFDFANTRNPILFYMYDLDKYQNTLRGFYLDVERDLPGPILFTTDEVVESILNIESVNDEYSDKYDEFYQRFCGFEDGNASERIVSEIFKK